jgi:hypothetical protein
MGNQSAECGKWEILTWNRSSADVNTSTASASLAKSRSRSRRLPSRANASRSASSRRFFKPFFLGTGTPTRVFSVDPSFLFQSFARKVSVLYGQTVFGFGKCKTYLKFQDPPRL